MLHEWGVDARDPDLYRAEYQRGLGALRREYERRGMRYKAIMHDPGGPLPGEDGEDGEDAESVRDN